MHNSEVLFIFSHLDRKHPFWANLVQKLRKSCFVIARMSLRKVTLFQALQNGEVFIWTNKKNTGYSRKYVNEIL